MASHCCNTFLKDFKPGKELDDLLYEDITEQLVGSFATYLSKHATKYCKPNGDLLMWNSIAGYFSAFKTFIIKKFRDKPIPHALGDAHMKMMTTEMRSKKIEICNSNNDAWVNPHEMVSDDDNKALGALCYWDGSSKSAEYYHLYRSMVNNAGRGSEISCLAWPNAVPTVIKESDGSSYTTLQLNVKRLKTAAVSPKPDETIHFVHRDSLLDDYLFSMLYHLVVSEPVSDQTAGSNGDTRNSLMFPLWAGRVSNAGGSQTESTVSKAFREQWKWIHSIASAHCSNFNEQLPADLDDPILMQAAETLDEYFIGMFQLENGIHCGKKRCLQIMGDSYLPPQHLMGRAGWALKTFNTFFDYWVTSKSSMTKSGKVLSGWKVGESVLDFASAVPPTFATSELTKVQIDVFVSSLIGDNDYVHPELKLLLVANAMRWYKEFIELLEKEPSQRYVQDVNQKHPFAIAVERARIAAGLDKAAFDKMQTDIEMGFYRANAYHIPDFLAKIGGEDVLHVPHTTTLREWISMSDSRTQSMMNTINQLQQSVSSLVSQNTQIISQNNKIMAGYAQ